MPGPKAPPGPAVQFSTAIGAEAVRIGGAFATVRTLVRADVGLSLSRELVSAALATSFHLKRHDESRAP